LFIFVNSDFVHVVSIILIHILLNILEDLVIIIVSIVLGIK